MELIPRHIKEEGKADLAIKLANINELRALGEDAGVGPIMLNVAEVLTKGFHPISVASRGVAARINHLRAADEAISQPEA